MSSSALRTAKKALGQVAENAWASALAGSALVRRRGIEHWRSGGGQRVLAIAPHPDDEAIGCAGTLLRHKRAGDQVGLVYVTDGGQSRALGLKQAAMIHRRRYEAALAAQRLGADEVVWLGLPEGAWAEAELRASLATAIRDWAPQIIYAPSRVDFHPEHWRVAQALAQVLAASAGERSSITLRIYQIQVPLTAILVNLVTPVAGVLAESQAVYAAYQTQHGSVARTARMRRYAARFYGLGGPGEEFWQLSAAEYDRLHRGSPDEWHRFRSLRAHAISDLLAYWQGRGERRRLRRALAEGGVV
jgi:LmbE family N-acetylglucosaminyl deacetylase